MKRSSRASIGFAIFRVRPDDFEQSKSFSGGAAHWSGIRRSETGYDAGFFDKFPQNLAGSARVTILAGQRQSFQQHISRLRPFCDNGSDFL
jgi:hypothetical protein